MFFMIGEDMFDKPPVVAGMVPDLHVAQLMDHDIIDDFSRGHDQPPGEGKAVIRRAGAPAAPRIIDGDSPGGQPQKPAEATYPLFKMQTGLFLIPEVKKNAGSSDGITPQKEFTAGKYQGLIRIIPVMHLQDVVFTQIGELFPGDEGPDLSIMIVPLLPADDLLQPLIFFFQ